MDKRFPFKLNDTNAKRIIASACEMWRDKLIKIWAVPLLRDGYEIITEDFYKEMRSACTKPQHALFDEIFGKDPEMFKDGQLCFVKSEEESKWHLRHADGKGNFYTNGYTSGATTSWKYAKAVTFDETVTIHP